MVLCSQKSKNRNKKINKNHSNINTFLRPNKGRNANMKLHLVGFLTSILMTGTTLVVGEPGGGQVVVCPEGVEFDVIDDLPGKRNGQQKGLLSCKSNLNSLGFSLVPQNGSSKRVLLRVSHGETHRTVGDVYAGIGNTEEHWENSAALNDPDCLASQYENYVVGYGHFLMVSVPTEETRQAFPHCPAAVMDARWIKDGGLAQKYVFTADVVHVYDENEPGPGNSDFGRLQGSVPLKSYPVSGTKTLLEVRQYFDVAEVQDPAGEGKEFDIKTTNCGHFPIQMLLQMGENPCDDSGFGNFAVDVIMEGVGVIEILKDYKEIGRMKVTGYLRNYCYSVEEGYRRRVLKEEDSGIDMNPFIFRRSMLRGY